MVRHNHDGFFTQSKPLALHRRRYHLISLSRAYYMGEQGITAVQDTRNRVPLVRLQLYLRVHPDKIDMPAVIFTGTGGIKQLIVNTA